MKCVKEGDIRTLKVLLSNVDNNFPSLTASSYTTSGGNSTTVTTINQQIHSMVNYIDEEDVCINHSEI